MIFSQYSWGDFFKVAGSLTVPYYGIVAWKYYREDIRDWFTKQRSGEANTSPVQTDAETEDSSDDSSLFVVKDYQPAPQPPKKRSKKAKAKTGDEVGTAPRPKRKKADSVVATDPAPGADSRTESKAPNEEPKPEAATNDSQTDSDVSFLPEVPVITEAALPQDFMFELGGLAESQSELVLDAIIEAAQNLEKGEDGAVVATEPEKSNETVKTLAQVMNGQKAKSMVAGIDFNR